MIQIRMQQGLSQDARIIRQEVFVEGQGFHHEFDEINQAAWHLVDFIKFKIGRAHV